MKRPFRIVLLMVLLGICGSSVAADRAERPNILVVLVLVGGLAWATGQLVGYWAASRPVRDDD